MSHTIKSFKSEGDRGNIVVGIVLFIAAILIAILISGDKNEADIYQSGECGGLDGLEREYCIQAVEQSIQ